MLLQTTCINHVTLRTTYGTLLKNLFSLPLVPKVNSNQKKYCYYYLEDDSCSETQLHA